MAASVPRFPRQGTPGVGAIDTLDSVRFATGATALENEAEVILRDD